MAPPVHPSTPPGDTQSTPTLPSPLSPPLPKTPHVSLSGGLGTAQQHLRTSADHVDAMTKDKNPSSRPSAAGTDSTSISLVPAETSPVVSPGRESAQVDDDQVFPSEADLQRMKLALESSTGDATGQRDATQQRDELAAMVRWHAPQLTHPQLKSLLDDYNTRIPFLQQQIEAQQEIILALNQQSRLSTALYEIERCVALVAKADISDRFAAERASWHAETQALIRTRDAETAAGNRPKRVLDLDVGYHQELEAANKRLEMDNRLMAPRVSSDFAQHSPQLVDTQKQIESLVNELRLLRTHVILDSSVFEGDAATSSRSAGARHSPASNRSTMGDARAEHLLLAAKKVRTMRKDDKSVGHLTLDELQRRGVIGPGGGIGYSEGYGGVDDGEDELPDSDLEDVKPSTSPMSNRRTIKSSGTPLPRSNKKSKRTVPITPSRSRGAPLVPQTTPGGNFNDLLLAAELATRPGTPSRSAASTSRVPGSSQYSLDSPSKKRRRQAPATVEWSTRRHLNEDDDGSPRKSAPSTGGTDDSHEASALDLLAQASQDVAQSSQSSTGGMLASAARLGGAIDSERDRFRPPGGRAETPLGPAINLEGSPTPTPSRATRENPFANPSSTPGAFSSPIGGAVPGIGKYVHLSSAVPARRVRSPYLKWTKEEVGKI